MTYGKTFFVLAEAIALIKSIVPWDTNGGHKKCQAILNLKKD